MLWFGCSGKVVFDVCRVDGKDMVSVPQRRLSFDCKTSKPVFSLHSDIIGHIGGGSENVEKVSGSPLHLQSDGPFLPGRDLKGFFSCRDPNGSAKSHLMKTWQILFTPNASQVSKDFKELADICH